MAGTLLEHCRQAENLALFTHPLSAEANSLADRWIWSNRAMQRAAELPVLRDGKDA